MAKKSLKQQSHDIQKAFLSLHTADEVFAFLRDLCTTDEIQEFVQRFAIAELLVQKKSYKEIEKITGVSSTTIARVAKFLHGKGGGYKKVFSRMK